MASVYWIKSFVPIERKSSLRMNIGSANAAAGTSIIPPSGTYSSNFTPSERSCSLASATQATAWLSSWNVVSIGIRISALP